VRSKLPIAVEKIRSSAGLMTSWPALPSAESEFPPSGDDVLVRWEVPRRDERAARRRGRYRPVWRSADRGADELIEELGRRARSYLMPSCSTSWRSTKMIFA